jgi:hypothetical protein
LDEGYHGRNFNWYFASSQKEVFMIKGVHATFYTPKAEELRAFIRDTLELPYTDIGGNWLIFDIPEAEIACHPSDTPFHDISFSCDNLQETISQLKKKGVEFVSEITETSWGIMTSFKMSGDIEAILFQPKYGKKAS